MNSDDGLLIRYLLGESPEAEKDEVERRIVVEEGFAEQLDAMQDELMRDRLRGELTASQEALFRRNLLGFPEAAERYEALRALFEASRPPETVAAEGPRHREVATIRSGRSPLWLPAAAAVVITVCYAGYRVLTPGSETSKRGSLLSANPAVVLNGGARGVSNEPRRLTIPAGATTVRFDLNFDTAEDFESYEVRVAAVDSGTQVWARTGLHLAASQPNRSVIADVPAEVLAPAEYTFRLIGHGRGEPEVIQGYAVGILASATAPAPAVSH